MVRVIVGQQKCTLLTIVVLFNLQLYICILSIVCDTNEDFYFSCIGSLQPKESILQIWLNDTNDDMTDLTYSKLFVSIQYKVASGISIFAGTSFIIKKYQS